MQHSEHLSNIWPSWRRKYSNFFSFGLVWPLFPLFQFPAVLRWLEPTSAYLEVYYVDAGWSSANNILVKKFSQGGLFLRTFLYSGTSKLAPSLESLTRGSTRNAYRLFAVEGEPATYFVTFLSRGPPIHMWETPSLDPITPGSTIFYVYSAPLHGKSLLDVPSTYLGFLGDR